MMIVSDACNILQNKIQLVEELREAVISILEQIEGVYDAQEAVRQKALVMTSLWEGLSDKQVLRLYHIS